uniref:Putative secreted peptide n=1 Tax=Anopheles braziliensis TaxID=58242 RepID=A0A2M3ZQM3_9DIPT
MTLLASLIVPGTYMLPVSGTRICLPFQSGLKLSRASFEAEYFERAIFMVLSESWNNCNSLSSWFFN